MDLIGVLLRALHVVLGVFWAGTLFFVVLFLDPGVRASGPEGGRVMQALQQRHYLAVMITVGAVTLLSGLLLLSRIPGGFSIAWASSRMGFILWTGAAAGIIAFCIGFFVSRPTLARMGTVSAALASAGGPPDPAKLAELQGLRDRMTLAARLVAALLFLCILCMALARYL